MIFHDRTLSSGRNFRYTLVEVMVVISILGVLMAISSNVAVKSKKAVISQYSKIMPKIPDNLDAVGKDDGSDDAASQKSEQKTSVRSNMSKAGFIRSSSSGQEKNSESNTVDRKINVLRRAKRPAAADPVKAAGAAAESAEQEETLSAAAEQVEVEDFPEPEGIVPGKTIVTISAPEAPETEIFAKFLHQKGSSAPAKEYYQSWKFDTEELKKEKKSKLDRGIDVPLFSQYLRKKTVFETSPYRTYVLRKQILLASRQTYDPEKSKAYYKALAEKRFTLARKGKLIRIVSVRGKEYSGVYDGVFRKQIRLKRQNFRASRWVPLDLVPEKHRWRFDEAALNVKREEFVKQALAKEEELRKKQNEYIRKTLDAEFIMLKKDKLMTKIR